jgi:serine/threonine protein kinase
MGEVYLAADARLGRKIAIKVLPAHFTSQPQSVRRFVREAKAASALNHPNIITIYDIGEADGTHYIVMEHIQGQTLRRLMAPADRQTIIDIALQTASALQAAHEAGIIHRDIKPENVMMRPDGLVKVLDFGIAKLTERPSPVVTADYEKQESLDIEAMAEVTTPGMIVGTVSYMSPEQILGEKIDTRTDIFSLGTMLYEVIAGKSPFYGQSQAER